MSYYRTYRPQVISEIDNRSVRERLMALLTKDLEDLPHAYLFIGPKGTGKTTAARLVAKIFNCKKLTKTRGPCGVCDQCRSIAENTNVDVLEIDAASNRGIDEIRTLRERIALAPASARYKVYVIDEVHMLTTEAFNALLKTLEEPPAHAIFVLATTDAQKIPATIVSRCMVVHFSRAQEEELRHALARIARKEKLPVDDAALAVITQYADGSFRDAVKSLEQVSFHKGKITEDVVRTVLSVSEEKMRREFLACLAKRDAAKVLSNIQQLVDRGNDIKAFLVECLNDMEEELVALVSEKPSDTWKMADLQDAIRRLSDAYKEMRATPITQLPLELAVVEFCQTGGPHAETPADVPLESVLLVTKGDTVRGNVPKTTSLGLLTLEKLTECWKDVIEELKPYNHSVAGVLRSSRPKSVKEGVVTIEAFYSFHKEKLSEAKNRQILVTVLKKLFGENVKVEIVVGKK